MSLKIEKDETLFLNFHPSFNPEHQICKFLQLNDSLMTTLQAGDEIVIRSTNDSNHMYLYTNDETYQLKSLENSNTQLLALQGTGDNQDKISLIAQQSLTLHTTRVPGEVREIRRLLTKWHSEDFKGSTVAIQHSNQARSRRRLSFNPGETIVDKPKWRTPLFEELVATVAASEGEVRLHLENGEFWLLPQINEELAADIPFEWVPLDYELVASLTQDSLSGFLLADQSPDAVCAHSVSRRLIELLSVEGEEDFSVSKDLSKKLIADAYFIQKLLLSVGSESDIMGENGIKKITIDVKKVKRACGSWMLQKVAALSDDGSAAMRVSEFLEQWEAFLKSTCTPFESIWTHHSSVSIDDLDPEVYYTSSISVEGMVAVVDEIEELANSFFVHPIFPKVLPAIPAERLFFLFSLKKRWKATELGPKLVGALKNAGSKESADEFLLKNARSLKLPGGVYWEPNAAPIPIVFG